MSEWTQKLQDYYKAHCQDNSWKNVPLSVPQSSMLAFIEHIEFLTTLSNYWEDTAKSNKTLENELLVCKHISVTMTKLHDEKCKKVDELETENKRLREALFYIQTGFDPDSGQEKLCIEEMQEAAASALSKEA